MTRPALSVFVFGIYLLLLGAVLIIAPNLLLSIFRIPPTTEVWIHVAGMLVLLLGVYYVLSARAELRPFFAWSVYVRASVIFFFIAFVLLGLAPSQLILFGVVDLLGADVLCPALGKSWRCLKSHHKGTKTRRCTKNCIEAQR